MLKVTASAPAKLILCGEHAAVFFQPAIVMAIDKQAYVTVEPRGDQAIFINSQDLGVAGLYERNSFKPKIGGIGARAKLEPIRVAAEKAIKVARKRIGVNISIDSKIPVAAGLGSSAAVAVATIAATGRLLNLQLSKERICSLAYEAEKIVHYHPSGIDNYISTYGGINVFRRGKGFTPLKARKAIPLVIGNTRIPRSTGKLVGHVHGLKRHYPNVVNPAIRAIGQLSLIAAKTIEDGDLEELGELMDINHGLLAAMGLSNEELDRLIYVARRAGALGAKLTGAGGGGCMIALTMPNKLGAVAGAIRKAGGVSIIAKKASGGVRVWSD